MDIILRVYFKHILLKNEKLNPKFIFTRQAFNVRNNEIGAIIGKCQLKRLNSIISKRAESFLRFLSLAPDWIYKDFFLDGQSNYAFNIILKSMMKDRAQSVQVHSLCCQFFINILTLEDIILKVSCKV